MSTPNVVAICGSLRQDSYNRKALQVAKHIAAEAGANVSELDLRECVLPHYDGDLEEQGFPGAVARARKAAAVADVFLIASPEYNGSVTGVLKNAIDWLSRQPKILPGKVAVVFGASPGLNGTVRGQRHLRDILTDTGLLMLPKPVVLVRSAGAAFHQDGSFNDPKTHEMLHELIFASLDMSKRMRREDNHSA